MADAADPGGAANVRAAEGEVVGTAGVQTREIVETKRYLELPERLCCRQHRFE